MAKLIIKLSKFDIEYKPQTIIKGQAVANFILEFTQLDSVLSEGNLDEAEWRLPVYKMFMDGSTNREGFEVGIILESPSYEKILEAFKLDLTSSNIKVDYEALLTGLKMEKDMVVKAIQVFCDSKLVS